MPAPSEQLLYHATQARCRLTVPSAFQLQSKIQNVLSAYHPIGTIGEMPVRKLNALIDLLVAGIPAGLPAELVSYAVSVSLAETAVKTVQGKRAPVDKARLLLKTIESATQVGWDKEVYKRFVDFLRSGRAFPAFSVHASPEELLLHFCGSDPKAVWDMGPFAYIADGKALLCSNRVFVSCPASLFVSNSRNELVLVRFLEVAGKSVVVPAEKEGAKDPQWFRSISKRHEQLKRLEALLRGESVPLGEVDASWLSAYAAGAASVSRLWFSHMFGEMGDGEYSLFFLLSAMLGNKFLPPMVELFGFPVPPLSTWLLVELSEAEQLKVSVLKTLTGEYLVFTADKGFMFALEVFTPWRESSLSRS